MFNSNVRLTSVIATAAILCALTFSSPVRAQDDTDTAAPPAKVTPLTKAQKSEIRLQLDKARLDAQTGKSDEASEIIDSLKTKYPNNPDVLSAEANLSSSGPSGSPSTVLADLCEAQNLDPSNADILQREPATSLVSRGNYGCGGYNRRITNEAYEQMFNISGQMALAPDLAIGLDFQNDSVNTRQPFIRSNGSTQSFYGNRQQATATADKLFGKSDEVTGLLYLMDDNAGAGIKYRHFDSWGSTAVIADYHRPNWDYIESVVQNGSIDDIRVERQIFFTKDINATLQGLYKRYSLDNDGATAEAPGWNFDLDYDHDFAAFGSGYSSTDDFLTFGAHYNVDAEYFTHIEKRLSTGGVVFNPLPAQTYEIHSFTFALGKTFFEKVKVAGFGGYGVNRISGSSGPLYGGSITYSPIKHLGIDVHGSRTLLGGQNESEKEDILGASLKWMW